MLEKFSVRIKIIQNDVCVAAMTSSKQDEFKPFIKILKESKSIWTNVYSSFKAITCLENYIQLHIAFSLWILITVDKRFI